MRRRKDPEQAATPVLRLAVRIAQILLVLVHHALGAGFEQVRALVVKQRRATRPAILPGRLRRTLEDLGVGFVKLGQLLSARADVLPDRFRWELTHLRDNVRPVPLPQVVAEIEASCDAPLDDIFRTFSPQPLAAASVSQVHRAELPDGRQVAVKVRRPGVVRVSRADLTLLGALARLAQRVSKRARLFGLVGVVAELDAMIRQELDFITEAENAAVIRDLFADDATVVVPEIIKQLSGPTVIVMDYVEGISLGDAQALEVAGFSRKHLAASVIRANVAMVLGPTRFHADLHPGNLLALPEGRLALLDFGSAGTATSPLLQAAVSPIVEAMATGDPDLLTEGVLLMTTAHLPVDRGLLSQELDQVVLEPMNSALGAVQMGKLLRDLVGVLRRHGLSVNPEITLLLRAVMTCESTAQELDPDVSFRKVVVPFLVDRACGWDAPVAGWREGEGEPPVPAVGL